MTTTDTYSLLIKKTTDMVRDKAVQRLAEEHGLHVLDVTWEDTGRFDFSAVGPNISDMTIQVQHQVPGREDYELNCMPVIRYPNFSDISGDISPDEFFLLVGNEKGQSLEKITLRELLGNLRGYLNDPDSWHGERTSLLSEDRDSHVLVNAQACFLPSREPRPSPSSCDRPSTWRTRPWTRMDERQTCDVRTRHRRCHRP
jgi:hypothetical protein